MNKDKKARTPLKTRLLIKEIKLLRKLWRPIGKRLTGKKAIITDPESWAYGQTGQIVDCDAGVFYIDLNGDDTEFAFNISQFKAIQQKGTYT